ncbi:MAG: IS1595 family transposase [Rhizobiales bacterium]|nr:IS1595 family transposase [Hyphomicrobiales bacterium]
MSSLELKNISLLSNTKSALQLFPSRPTQRGVSSHQLDRALGITYKSAWFLTNLIREAMRAVGLTSPMGSVSGIVEVNETYVGRTEGQPVRRGGASHKNTVITLVERGGSARPFHVDGNRAGDILPIIRANLSREARLMTDELHAYKVVVDIAEIGSHETVTHCKKEYVRGDINTNTVEGYYSIFKRGMKGAYQHCAEKHRHRYLSEFDFRYSNRIALGVTDGERADLAIKGAAGKQAN